MALIQLDLECININLICKGNWIIWCYKVKLTQLMEDKNHDYGEVWREMRISSQLIWFCNYYRVSKKTKEKQLFRRYWRQLGHDQLFHFCTDTNGFR
jgi:hypothetical protein